MSNLTAQKPLTLMVYDSSDTKTSIRKIRAGIAGGMRDALDLVLPDDIEESDFAIPLGLTHTWVAGGWLYRIFGRVSDLRGCQNWHEALLWLSSVSPHRPIKEIQFWGHGTPGRSWMLKDGCLDYRSPYSARYGEMMRLIRSRLTPDARIWFRNCSVFAGKAGHDFAKSWTDFFQCRVSAHTHIINFWQAGLHTARPGVEPHWSLEEGNGGRAISTYSSPNCITCISDSFPEEW